MSFNSQEFLLFYLVVFCLYWALPTRPQNWLLLAASYFFYATWDYRFLSLLFLSSLIGYAFGLAIGKAETPGRKKAFLAASVVLNLGILGFFKYFHFVTENLSRLFDHLGIAWQPPAWNVLLPVGISFYLFHTLSYLIDIYRGLSRPSRNFGDVALFVAFFPLLVAGPIERAGHLLPEIQKPRSFSGGELLRGMDLILWGFFKKIFIADNLARQVAQVYNDPGSYGGMTVLLATYAFAIQIYCDFSGYTDIARGVSKSLGFELNLNFNLPYFAKSPSDFWRRWHISLSSWLRDYLYISLGGNRGGMARTYRNLMVTMLLGGIWHGANWTFLLWGFFHGSLLILQRMVQPLAARLPSAGGGGKWTAFFQIFLMFHVTCVGWLIFRSNSLADLLTLVRALAVDFRADAFTAQLWHGIVKYGWFLALVQAFQFARGNLRFFPAAWLEARWAFYMFLLCSIFFLGNFEKVDFIYFQF